MSTLSIRLPKSLHQKVKDLAKREGVSINQIINVTLAEKVAADEAMQYLEDRAKRGNRERYLELLGKAPDVPPIPEDQ
jgi:predicted transcriptional regulator